MEVKLSFGWGTLLFYLNTIRGSIFSTSLKTIIIKIYFSDLLINFFDKNFIIKNLIKIKIKLIAKNLRIINNIL